MKKSSIAPAQVLPETPSLPPFSIALLPSGTRFLRAEASLRGFRYVATIGLRPSSFALLLVRIGYAGDEVRFSGEASTLLGAGAVLRAAFVAEGGAA